MVSSSDGTRLLASEYDTVDTNLVQSVNGGQSWASLSGPGKRQWTSLASSADGSRLAATWGGGMALSKDGGGTWSYKTSSNWWPGLAISADGNLLAYIDNGALYTSSNFGATATQRSIAAGVYPNGLAACGNALLIAYDYDGYIYTSNDWGASFVRRDAAGQRRWWDAACSADGMRIVAAEAGAPSGSGKGFIYTSSDGGQTWDPPLPPSPPPR